MQWWTQKFIEHFEVNHIGIDLLNMLEKEDGEGLFLYIHDKFADNFTREEIIEKFKNELSEEDLEAVLNELF